MGKQKWGKILIVQIDINKAIDVPTKVRDIFWFVGIVKYYKGMWHKSTHTLATLTKFMF